MKLVLVELWAFQNGAVRPVKVPDEACGSVEEMLNAAFHYGQNDIQPVDNRCSVSAGDVILLDGERYLVAVMGFKKLTDAEYQQHIARNPIDRFIRSFNNGEQHE